MEFKLVLKTREKKEPKALSEIEKENFGKKIKIRNFILFCILVVILSIPISIITGYWNTPPFSYVFSNIEVEKIIPFVSSADWFLLTKKSAFENFGYDYHYSDKEYTISNYKSALLSAYNINSTNTVNYNFSNSISFSDFRNYGLSGIQTIVIYYNVGEDKYYVGAKESENLKLYISKNDSQYSADPITDKIEPNTTLYQDFTFYVLNKSTLIKTFGDELETFMEILSISNEIRPQKLIGNQTFKTTSIYTKRHTNNYPERIAISSKVLGIGLNDLISSKIYNPPTLLQNSTTTNLNSLNLNIRLTSTFFVDEGDVAGYFTEYGYKTNGINVDVTNGYAF